MPEGLVLVVRSMGTVPWVAFLVGAGGLTVFAFVMWRRSFQNARVMEDTPTSRVRSAAQGFVELAGMQETAMDRPPMAPITGREVTWWSYSIEERKSYRDSNGHRKTRWDTLESKTSPHLIRLVDDTGEVVVNPAGADVTPSVKRVWYGTSRKPTRSPGGGGFSLFSGGGRYRYTESYMRPGEPLFALGHFETRTSAPDTRERARRRTELLAAWKEDPAALAARFDEDGDGRVDMREWERARDAAKAAVEEQAAREARKPEAHLLLKPPNGRPFLLSVKSQEELARSYRIRSVGWVLLFLVGVVACGVLLTGRLGS